LGSMSRWETMYLSSMPCDTPKTHFLRFSFTPFARRHSNVTRKY
jgi:hypothetical protein